MTTPVTATSGPGDLGRGIHCGRHRRASKAAHPVPRLEPEITQTSTISATGSHGNPPHHHMKPDVASACDFAGFSEDRSGSAGGGNQFLTDRA